jgi:hypothetical protein
MCRASSVRHIQETCVVPSYSIDDQHLLSSKITCQTSMHNLMVKSATRPQPPMASDLTTPQDAVPPVVPTLGQQRCPSHSRAACPWLWSLFRMLTAHDGKGCEWDDKSHEAYSSSIQSRLGSRTMSMPCYCCFVSSPSYRRYRRTKTWSRPGSGHGTHRKMAWGAAMNSEKMREKKGLNRFENSLGFPMQKNLLTFFIF